MSENDRNELIRVQWRLYQEIPIGMEPSVVHRDETHILVEYKQNIDQTRATFKINLEDQVLLDTVYNIFHAAGAVDSVFTALSGLTGESPHVRNQPMPIR